MNSWTISQGSALPAKPLRLLSTLAVLACMVSAHAGTVQIKNEVAGTTPEALGYNLSYFYDGSNAEDWWRYSGVKAVRIFMSNTAMEPEDDNGKPGDGVTTEKNFKKKQAALRAMGDSGTQFVKWKKFEDNIKVMGSNFTAGYAMDTLRGLGVEILATISATKTRFPLESNTEYGNMWELWQHYYAVAFILARDYDVHRFTIYNEPDNTNTVTPTNLNLRLRVTADAIRAAVADVNSRYAKSFVPQIMAPNTSNPSYEDLGPDGKPWGRTTVLGRHVDMWDKTSADFRNFDIYNYQKYTHRQFRSDGFNGYTEDCQILKDFMTADMPGETIFPIALTEWNTRAQDGYDTVPNHADTPFDYAALGASAVALSSVCQAKQLYLFKFGMTPNTDKDPSYAITKNGAHHADVAEGLHNYGTAAGSGEVWRLFAKAAGVSRDRYAYVNPFTRDVWTLATRDAASQTTYIFFVNKTAADIQAGFDLSAFGIANGSLVTVSEVSSTARGAVKRLAQVNGGMIAEAPMPAYSVWLLAVHEGLTAAPTQVPASDATALRDGSGKNATGANPPQLVARAINSPDDRRVGLLKFNLPPDVASKRRVLLSLNTMETLASSYTHGHVYGVEYDSWDSSTATWATLSTVLKQDVPAGNMVFSNIVNRPTRTTKIQGQLIASSMTPTLKYIDVTDFVKAQTNGKATFLLTQDHRWNYNLETRGAGDTQTAGIVVDGRNGAVPPVLLMY